MGRLRTSGEEEEKGHENPLISDGSGSSGSKAADESELDENERNPKKDKQGAIGALEEGLVKGGLSSLAGPAGTGANVVSSFFNRKKKTLAGVAVGLVIGISGVLGFGVIQGPLQLMHLAQILQNPFSDQEEASENRLGGLLRFARTNDIGETRVSILGSKSAKKTFARLEKETGIKIIEKTAGGRPSVVEIDTSKYAPGATTKEAALAYADQHGIPRSQVQVDALFANREGGRFRVGEAGQALPDSAARSIFKEGIGKLYGKLAGPIMVAVKARPVFAKNGNFSKLRIWKRLNTYALEKALEADKARKARKAEKTPKAESRLSKLKGKLRPVAAIGAAASALQLGGCVAKDIAHETPLATYENVVAPSENQALEFISGDSQLRAGEGFVITQPGALVKNLSNKEGSAYQSKALNSMVYQDGGAGKEAPDDYRGSFSPNSPEAEVEEGLDQVGGEFICSDVGQAVGALIGIGSLIFAAPTGGLAPLAIYGGAAVGSTLVLATGSYFLTKAVVGILADEPIYKDPQGTDLGHTLAYGSQALAADLYRKSGAGPIEGQTTTSKPLLSQSDDFQQKSFFARTFDVHDYRSLASRTIDNSNFNAPQTMASLANSFSTLGSLFSNMLNVFSPQIFAAGHEGAYDFGFPRYGFTQADLDNPLTEDPYKNADKAVRILKSDDDYVDRAKDCFGVTFDEDNGWKVDVVDNPDGDPEKDVLPNTAKYHEANCGDTSDKWLIIRLFIFDSRTMEAYACYEGVDENACIQPEEAPVAPIDDAPEQQPETTDCEVDSSAAPGLTDLAQFIDQECEKDLPIIEDLMGRPSPFAEPHKIKIVEASDMTQGENGAALGLVFFETNDDYNAGQMLLNKDYLRQNASNKQEIRGLLVHELTHVSQGYGVEPGLDKIGDMFGDASGDGIYQFVTEGGADYIKAAFPAGTGPRSQNLTCVYRGWRVYTAGYRCGSALLTYIHDSYSKNVIKKLNGAIRDGEYSDSFFTDLTGKDLNTLFNECIKNPRSNPLCKGGIRQ